MEFALIVPFLILLAFGSVEIANALTNARKVEVLSRTLGDLVSRTATPTRAAIDDIFRSSEVVLMPYGNASLELVVSAVGVFGGGTSGDLRVCSSVAAGGAKPRAIGEVPEVALPPEFQLDGTRLLLVDVRMKYDPVTGTVLAGALGKLISGMTLSRHIYWPVRFGRRYASQSPEVVLPGGTACSVSPSLG